MIVAGTHDTLLVVTSILIAALASYAALDLASRIRVAQRRVRLFWLGAAALALGGGIWSMHFVAMLAFRMPGMGVAYDPGLTLLSLLLALVFTGIGFRMTSRGGSSWRWLVAAGLLMGLGIVAMHYVGMAAMRMPARVHYLPDWFALSILIAIGAATVALRLASSEQGLRERVAAAGMMGLAIAGMHYAGMAGAVFTMDAHAAAPAAGAGVSQRLLAILVTAVTLVILLLALGAATLDRRFAIARRREGRAALRLRLADVMRDADTEAALREAAALMGEHFGVERVGYGQLDAGEGVFDYQVCWTDGSVPPLLGRYPAQAFGAKIVADLSRGRTIVVNDLMKAAISDESETRVTAGEVDTRAVLVVPFLRGGQLHTIVYLNSRAPRAWTQGEVTFMEEVAERTRQVIARAEVEAELRELNATLEARVEERTAELKRAEAALRQSQKMEAIGQLTGGIAHDFNNMLTGVIGSLDIMKRRIEAGRVDDLDRFMEAASSSAQRAAALTSRLLAFARRQSLDSRPTDINQVVRSLEELLARTMSEQIAVTIDLGAELPPALVDPNQLESAILNLAINARDAMPAGGRLTISTRREDADGLVAVTVADTGVGMDADTIERAFEPFFTTKAAGQGTGLGLSMVYGFASQSKGHVRIASTPGKGTQVTILLPASAEPLVAPAPGLPRLHMGDGQSVLLVEDDDAVRLLVRDVLHELGYTTTEATEADAALAILADGAKFDLLVTDVGLPGRNGRELADLARGYLPDLPVLFVTGYAADAADRAGFLGPGMDMIFKPFQVGVLSAKIGEMLGRRAAA